MNLQKLSTYFLPVMNNKKYLLDTHVLIWWLTDDNRLSQKVREIIKSPENHIFLSAASVWELSIKLSANERITMNVSLQEFIEGSGFVVIPITAEHAVKTSKLKQLHKDPFDRMLLAQAVLEECTFLSADKKIAEYVQVTPSLQVIF